MNKIESLNQEFDNQSDTHVDTFHVFALPDIPEIRKGFDISQIIIEKSSQIGGLIDNDIVLIASKIISKSEARIFSTTDIKDVSIEARQMSEKTGKPPELCQAILNESNKIRITGKTIIGYHKLGYVLTSAGVDRIDSNTIALIPRDPDDSARKIRQRLEKKTKKKLAVIVTDSEGREDRLGAGAVALGVSGIKPVVSIQLPDGKVTEETISDMLANSASLIMGQRGKNKPIVIVRGYNFERDENARMQDYLTFK
ncbi:MAG TPA: coenzyme F420-0:L-glutamate ligase [Candidatus Woesebacteria bacterium]|nr:coenzyme F420-0:L-glutamate ligase [Candidatus Woesebacteria bacterium]